MMDEAFLRVGADQRRSQPETFDAGEFARSIRRLAIEAHEILNRPDAVTAELVELRRRLRGHLRAARSLQLAAIERWLWSAHRALDARLLSSLVVALEPTVS
ncbi:MAG TPA: hypothetical protein VFF52_25020 [Isosphaeraceae bacterium]|nr:hypothetical protein [Isosphaeraceae bacterium]